MRSKSLFWATTVVACLIFPLSLTAATFTVGGDGADYATLELLRTSGVLRDGDTIILNGDDSSLTAAFTNPITIKGQGSISPAFSSTYFYNNTGSARVITFDTDSIEIKNFNSGAINAGRVNINGGENIFSDNTKSSSGGAICTGNIGVYITGGMNTFSGNTGSTYGGAIFTNGGTVSITGGINTFSDNTVRAGAAGWGGAIYSGTITITGGENIFTGNKAVRGGAIYAESIVTLRATDGDFTFRGNRDRVGAANEKANAIYLGTGASTFAAREGQNIFFYDPVTSSTNANRTININNQATDIGTVVFDGSDYTRDVDCHSAVYGNTIVGYGELALKGNVIYGAANNIGSFTLNDRATLTADEAMNQIWANTITMNGTVDIANNGTLLLSAAQGVAFNGTLNVGLGLESSGFLSVNGNLAFGNNALLSVYGDDLLGAVTDGWSDTYDLSKMFSATGNISGLANLMFDASWFDAYDGFSYEWLGNGILMLSYNEVPEPATLLMLGLGLTGIPVVRRFRKK